MDKYTWAEEALIAVLQYEHYCGPTEETFKLKEHLCLIIERQ